MIEPDTPQDLSPDNTCSICVALVWKYLGVEVEVRPVDDQYHDFMKYPSKIVAAVLAGTHTAHLRSSQQQLTIRAATMWKASPLCPTHAAKIVDREHLSYLHSPHSYGGYRR